MPTLLAVHKLLPPHTYPQSVLADALAEELRLKGYLRDLLYRLFEGTTVRQRHLALPLEEYFDLRSFEASNDRHFQAFTQFGQSAVEAALAAAGVEPEEVDMLITQSVTGISVPPVDVTLIDRLGFRPDVKRMPLFGFGCGGGGAGLALMHDYLRAWPDHVAVQLSTELCSLNVQGNRRTAESLLGAALCGDAAAAVVACGDELAKARSAVGPRTVATRARVYPGTTHMAGLRIGSWGFEVVLHKDLPDAFGAYVREDVHSFLSDHDLTVEDVAAWVYHPGGPKVLDEVAKNVGLPDDALDLSRAHLAETGNCSSASVLHVLADTMATAPPAGRTGILHSFGPGLFGQLVLLNW
ncbi:type III polyketide synthase [Streptomyces sp. NPDC001393]